MSGTNGGNADRLAYYVNQPYTVKILAYEQDGQIRYMAAHPELYGCIAEGRTPGEAVRNLDHARPGYLAALLDMGIDIPLPIGSTTPAPAPAPAVPHAVRSNRPPASGSWYAAGDLWVLYETGASLPAV